MSICDVMVVMREGIVQQIGDPQTVYDLPANLFVAEFLGSPQINTFDAEIRDGKLLIGGSAVLSVRGQNTENRPVTASVRPEGFILSEQSAFRCGLKRVEVLGKDRSIVFTHPAFLNGSSHAIISADETIRSVSDTVSFALKPSKVFLFAKDTEKRIPCELF